MKKFNFQTFMVFFILSATVALAYQIPYLRYTFYDQFAAAYQFSNTQIGLLASALTFTNTLCYPIGGFIADRFSTKTLICITLAAFAILTAIFALTTNFVVLIIVHILYGFFGIATLWSAYLNGIRNLADKDNQSKIFGSSEATRGIIQTIMGFAFLGILGIMASDAAGIKAVLLFGSGACVVFFILALIFLPKTEIKAVTEENAKEAEVKYSLMDVLKNPGVWVTIFVIMFAYISWTVGNGYLTTYTVQVLQISPATASALGIVRSYIIVLLAGFIGGFVLDKFTYKGKGFLVFFAAIIAAIAGVMLTSKVVPLCIALTLVIAFLANIMKSTYWSIMDQAGVPLGMTAIATGIISFIAFIPDFLVGPICGKWLDDAAAAGNIAEGFDKIFILLIVSSAIGIVSAVLLTQRTKKLALHREKAGEVL